MNKTELIIAHGTSDGMKKIAESLPPYDLLRAYREARATFNTPDILGGAVIDQGASTTDQATMPWGKSFVGVGQYLCQWDPSLSTRSAA